MRILRANLLLALQLAIEAQKARDEEVLGKGKRSGFVEGLEEVLAAVRKGEWLEVIGEA